VAIGRSEDGDVGRVTLQTVADAVGVSRMTVSNAFSRPDQLSPALRERILATAAEFGYSGPDPAARALARGRVGAVGVVMTESLGEAFLDPVAAAFFGAVAEELAPTGLAVTLIPASSIGDSLAARDLAIDAALLYACAGDAEAVQWLRRRKLPLVSVDREPEPDGSSIGLDERSGGRLAAEHLIALGHRDIAVFTIDPAVQTHGWSEDPSAAPANHVAGERLHGAREALERAGLRTRVFRVKDNHDRYVVPGAEALVADAARPTAVICFSDLMAAALVGAAQRAGLTVPRDLSVVGFDDSRIATTVTPALTTLRQDFVAKGRAAARALVTALEASRTDQPLPVDEVVVPVELVVRESTTVPPPAAD
jgi:DNA-binding LacI/PurR family transcriptional regulator